jgi:O-antigen/teichoic acid export membrane protein
MLKKDKKHFKFLLYSAENVSAMLFGLVGMALVARVFGPENMGRLSVVQAISAMFMFLATFGFDHFVLRDFTVNKDDGELKGSLIVAQSIGWILYLASIVIYFALQGSLAHEVFLITSVAVSTYFLRVLFLKLYLQAVNDAATIAISAVVSRIFALVYLLVGTFYHFSFDMMVLYLPLQAAVQAIMMLKGYQKAQKSQPTKTTVSYTRIKSMLRESMPVIFSTAIYFAYSQADVLIVSHFMGVKDVGIYSAAMRLIPQAAFLGHITVITFYGVLSAHYHTNKDEFLHYATKLLRIQITMAFVMAFSFSMLAPIIIWALYGNKFEESAAVLSIGVWIWIFMFPAALFTRLLVLTKLSKYDLVKTLTIAPISLGLNFFLIPKYGYTAAAYVSVITFMLGDFLFYALFKETRFIFKIGINAFLGLVKSPLVSMRESIALFKSKV